VVWRVNQGLPEEADVKTTPVERGRQRFVEIVDFGTLIVIGWM
jgi:hypothetical protein